MADERTIPLTYAVRGSVVLKYSAQLAFILAILTLVPLFLALAKSDWTSLTRYLEVCAGLFLLAGLYARLPAPASIQSNEALTITSLTFIFASLFMAWPIMGSDISFIDAWFESVSGVTTTGLSALGSIQHRPDTFLFARAWMQWYGGLGFIVLSVALLIGHQAVSRRLYDPVETGETLMATTRTHARRSLLVYVLLTLSGFLLLWAFTNNSFISLLHVLSAVSTGGFSSFDTSLAGIPGKAAIVVIIISFLGAVSLPLYWQVFHSGWRDGLRSLLLNVELRALLIACLLSGSLLVLLSTLQGQGNHWYQGFMLGFSAQTTTGFTTTSINNMDPASKIVMIISMLIGGSSGSSAGGFKIIRLLILLRLFQLMFRRTRMPPHAVAEPYFDGQKLESDEIIRAMQLLYLFIGLIFVSWIPFVVAGYDPLDSLFEVVSACGTVGLSSGITRPELEPFLKMVLCFDMLAGRLEVFALLVVISPRNWFGRRREMQ